MTAPATTREEAIPAEYRTETRKVTQTPATTKTVQIPAEYKTVTSRRLVRQGGFSEWKEILCPSQVTPATVRQVQESLRSRGYDPGPVDNVMGSRTKAALVKYQKDNGLPVGQLDLDTLRSLGLK